MRKTLTHPMLLAALLACAPLVLAATPQAATSTPPANAPRAQQPRQSNNLFDQLGLTDAQRSSVRQLMQQNFQQARPEFESLHQKRMAFDNATPGTSQFQSAANALAQAASNTARAEIMRQAALRTKIYNLLTAEQRTRLASLVSQRQQEMQQRHAVAPTASR